MRLAMDQNSLRAKQLMAMPCRLGEGPTDEQLAVELGISKARVYQLRLRAIAKIRQTVLEDPELAEFASELCGFDVTRGQKVQR